MKHSMRLHIFSLVFVVLIAALSLTIFSLKKQNNTFQFKQDRIDQQFSITLSFLCTELFDKQPVDETTIIELRSQLELLLPLTTYLEIENMDKIVKVLISAAENPTELSSSFTSDLIERIEYFASSLGRPLPDDIDTQSKSIYSDLSLLSTSAQPKENSMSSSLANDDGIEPFTPTSNSTWGDLHRHFDPEGFEALPKDIQEQLDNFLLEDVGKDDNPIVDTTIDDWTIVSTEGYLYTEN